VFTDRGRVYWLKVHEVPQGGRTAKGKAIVNMVEMSQQERVAAVLPVKEFDDTHFIMMVTKNGTAKKTPLSAYSNPRRGGIISIQATERNGRVVAALEVVPTDQVMLITRGGIVIRTKVSEISEIGRNTQGVRLINLEEGDQLIDVARVEEKDEGEEE